MSLHFWRASHDDVRQFVIGQGATGRIFASNPRWTCLVPFDRDDESRLLSHWEGIVLKWSYSEDYGLGLDFHRRGRMLGQASFIWGAVLTGQPPGGSFPGGLRSELLESGVLSTDSAADIENVIAQVAAGSISGCEVRDRVAAILELAAFEWLSPETCLQMGLEDTREDYPEAEDIEMA